MGKRRVYVSCLGIVILLLSFAATAVEPEITYEPITERDGFREVVVNTPLANYLFSEDGGGVRSVLLTFAPYGSQVAELVYGTTSDASTFARRYTVDAETSLDLRGEGADGTYTLEEPTYTDSGGLLLTFVGDLEAYTVTKRFTIEPDALYTVGLEVEVEAKPGAATDLRMTVGKYLAGDDARDLVALYDDEPNEALLTSGSYFTFGGVGVMDKNVVFFLRPDDGDVVEAFAEGTESGGRRFGVTMDLAERTTYRFTLYAGRRRLLMMREAGIEALDEPGIGARAMAYVIQFLNILYRATGNYGWAIILFTILMRVVLFPLMRKQYHSMAKMQKIQPKMKRIQERYKDNKQEMQQRVLELYKKEGVNPMGGCLPMLVQLPIIFLIWRALLYASELIHLSPGFLWIPDLSLHDPLFILVVVTTLIMLVQQRYMTPTTGEGQGATKYIGYIFPVMMAVLLWRFPAGLWLYYLLTTAAQVGQQAFVNWEMARADGGTVPAFELDVDDEEPASPGEGEGDGDGGAEKGS